MATDEQTFVQLAEQFFTSKITNDQKCIFWEKFGKRQKKFIDRSDAVTINPDAQSLKRKSKVGKQDIIDYIKAKPLLSRNCKVDKAKSHAKFIYNWMEWDGILKGFDLYTLPGAPDQYIKSDATELSTTNEACLAKFDDALTNENAKKFRALDIFLDEILSEDNNDGFVVFPFITGFVDNFGPSQKLELPYTTLESDDIAKLLITYPGKWLIRLAPNKKRTLECFRYHEHNVQKKTIELGKDYSTYVDTNSENSLAGIQFVLSQLNGLPIISKYSSDLSTKCSELPGYNHVIAQQITDCLWNFVDTISYNFGGDKKADREKPIPDYFKFIFKILLQVKYADLVRLLYTIHNIRDMDGHTQLSTINNPPYSMNIEAGSANTSITTTIRKLCDKYKIVDHTALYIEDTGIKLSEELRNQLRNQLKVVPSLQNIKLKDLCEEFRDNLENIMEISQVETIKRDKIKNIIKQFLSNDDNNMVDLNELFVTSLKGAKTDKYTYRYDYESFLDKLTLVDDKISELKTAVAMETVCSDFFPMLTLTGDIGITYVNGWMRSQIPNNIENTLVQYLLGHAITNILEEGLWFTDSDGVNRKNGMHILRWVGADYIQNLTEKYTGGENQKLTEDSRNLLLMLLWMNKSSLTFPFLHGDAEVRLVKAVNQQAYILSLSTSCPQTLILRSTGKEDRPTPIHYNTWSKWIDWGKLQQNTLPSQLELIEYFVRVNNLFMYENKNMVLLSNSAYLTEYISIYGGTAGVAIIRDQLTKHENLLNTVNSKTTWSNVVEKTMRVNRTKPNVHIPKNCLKSQYMNTSLECEQEKKNWMLMESSYLSYFIVKKSWKTSNKIQKFWDKLNNIGSIGKWCSYGWRGNRNKTVLTNWLGPDYWEYAFESPAVELPRVHALDSLFDSTGLYPFLNPKQQEFFAYRYPGKIVVSLDMSTQGSLSVGHVKIGRSVEYCQYTVSVKDVYKLLPRETRFNYSFGRLVHIYMQGMFRKELLISDEPLKLDQYQGGDFCNSKKLATLSGKIPDSGICAAIIDGKIFEDNPENFKTTVKSLSNNGIFLTYSKQNEPTQQIQHKPNKEYKTEAQNCFQTGFEMEMDAFGGNNPYSEYIIFAYRRAKISTWGKSSWDKFPSLVAEDVNTWLERWKGEMERTNKKSNEIEVFKDVLQRNREKFPKNKSFFTRGLNAAKESFNKFSPGLRSKNAKATESFAENVVLPAAQVVEGLSRVAVDQIRQKLQDHNSNDNEKTKAIRHDQQTKIRQDNNIRRDPKQNPRQQPVIKRNRCSPGTHEVVGVSKNGKSVRGCGDQGYIDLESNNKHLPKGAGGFLFDEIQTLADHWFPGHYDKKYKESYIWILWNWVGCVDTGAMVAIFSYLKNETPKTRQSNYDKYIIRTCFLKEMLKSGIFFPFLKPEEITKYSEDGRYLITLDSSESGVLVAVKTDKRGHQSSIPFSVDDFNMNKYYPNQVRLWLFQNYAGICTKNKTYYENFNKRPQMAIDDWEVYNCLPPRNQDRFKDAVRCKKPQNSCTSEQKTNYDRYKKRAGQYQLTCTSTQERKQLQGIQYLEVKFDAKILETLSKQLQGEESTANANLYKTLAVCNSTLYIDEVRRMYKEKFHDEKTEDIEEMTRKKLCEGLFGARDVGINYAVKLWDLPMNPPRRLVDTITGLLDIRNKLLTSEIDRWLRKYMGLTLKEMKEYNTNEQITKWSNSNAAIAYKKNQNTLYTRNRTQKPPTIIDKEVHFLKQFGTLLQNICDKDFLLSGNTTDFIRGVYKVLVNYIRIISAINRTLVPETTRNTEQTRPEPENVEEVTSQCAESLDNFNKLKTIYKAQTGDQSSNAFLTSLNNEFNGEYKLFEGDTTCDIDAPLKDKWRHLSNNLDRSNNITQTKVNNTLKVTNFAIWILIWLGKRHDFITEKKPDTSDDEDTKEETNEETDESEYETLGESDESSSDTGTNQEHETPDESDVEYIPFDVLKDSVPLN
jgi:hypothetical protein